MSRMPAVQNMSDQFVNLQIISKGTRPGQSIFVGEFPKSLVHDIEKQPQENRSNSTVVL